jgi:hypothetical protein
MKRGLVIVGMIALLGGLVGMTQAFTSRTKETVCTKLEVRLMNQNERNMVTSEQVVSFLKERGMYPVGLPLSAVNFRQVEQEVQGHRLIAGQNVLPVHPVWCISRYGSIFPSCGLCYRMKTITWTKKATRLD